MLQTASLSGDSESQRLKPFFCSAFPITIENGRLTLDRGVLGTSSRCCGPIPKGSESAFDACSEELDYVLGAEGLRELRSEVALFEAPRRRVAVLANDTESSPLARGDEAFECPDAADFDRALHAALREAGFSVSWHRVHLGNVDEVVDALDCDVVFNLCDGHGPGRDNLPGLEVLAALERRGLPYTGASAEPYALSISKVKMKELFVEAGVPTPPWQRFTTPSEPLDRALVGRSLIVKPEDSGGSAGIDLASIVAPDDEPALRARLEKTIREYGAALVEEYVDGRELTVGLLGPAERVEALPPVEVLFGEAFPPGRGIRTHHSKWDPTSPLYGGFELACPAPLTAAEERTAVDASRRAYAAIQGSGYGRVDLRLDARGVWVLEVNMNPSLEYGDRPGDTAMLPYAARAAGIEYPALLARMVHDALGGRVTGRLA